MNSSIFQSKIFRRAALASIVALGAFGASNSFAAGADAPSTATVITPITISNTQSLVFGKFAPSGAAGTVTVATDNSRSQTGNVILSNSGNPVTAATFLVEGDMGSSYSISWPAPAGLELSDNNATAPSVMTLSLLSATTASAATTSVVTSGTLGATSGSQIIYLGGTLTVGATQVAAAYTGSVTATGEYN